MTRSSLFAVALVACSGARAGAAFDSGYAIPAFAGKLSGAAAAPDEPLTLWYRQPAVQWTEALPIGNGRLGAMVFGGVSEEHLQLNEDTLWAGGPYDPVNPAARAALPEIRRLVFAGKYAAAADLVGAKFLATPLGQMPYQTLGDLVLSFPAAAEAKDYRRELDLDGAIARVEYSVDGVHFAREAFASPVDQVIVVRLTADKPGRISFAAALRTPQRAVIRAEAPGVLVMRGSNGDGPGVKAALTFDARVRVLAEGGTVSVDGDKVSVAGADSAILLVAAATSYRNYHDVGGVPEEATTRVLTAAGSKTYQTLLAAHEEEHRRLFRRARLDLGTTAAARRPTDERIRDFANGGDPQLAVLYFQFARYLLISSSRPGGQPANLQGLWNYSMDPPWGGKYTININTEMNYWPAEPTNLAECVEPLVSMLEDLSVTGARTAREMYGARGWVTHHNTDLWRATAPIDGPNWGMWPLGGAWLTLHLWDHYDYGGDKEFLAKAYPIMKGSAQFFLDTLVEEPKHHWLVTNPSMSPENMHPFGAAVSAGPTMDMQLLRDLFARTIRAAEILGVDAGFRARVAAARARLAPNQIGGAGQLQEWLDDWDLKAEEIHHRHVSHLYALYPSDQIDRRDTPELAAAARTSLELRGDRATGWASAWRINLWARLAEGDRAYGILSFLLSPERTYPDMFDAHPPFQIDGNFGGAAGIVEMLMRSRDGEIELLPALPKAWPSGAVEGLRARGGFEVGFAWKDGRLTGATIRSARGGECRVRLGEKTVEVRLKPGASVSLGADLS